MEYSFIDLIIRIKNGYMSSKESVMSPHSFFKESIVKKLKELGFIKDYIVNESDEDKKKTIIITLLYEQGVPVLDDLQIKSKPGKRDYVSYKSLKPVLNNFGYSILSTSKGILTNKEARKEKVGGELLFAIW